MSICSRSALGHKDELEADPVLKRSIREGRMGPWIDSCDVLICRDVVVTHNKENGSLG